MTATATATQEPETPPIMSDAESHKFRQILEAKRGEIVRKAKQSLEEDMMLDANEMPDEVDLASTEYAQAFALRLRGRERFFLQKIDTALRKLTEGEFGICEECEGMIGRKRLEARPEAPLCINCKEEEERHEREFRS